MYNLIKYEYDGESSTQMNKFIDVANKNKYVIAIFDNSGARTTTFLLNDINCLDFKEFECNYITIELCKNIVNYYVLLFECFVTGTEIYIEQ